MFISPFKLAEYGVLGMNARNVGYISRYNKRRLYPLVDNKLLTKKAAQRAGIAVPDLLGTIESQWQLRGLAGMLEPLGPFVIKPARGSGGKGIFVVEKHMDQHFFKPSGREYSLVDLHRHINNILSGLFSLGGKPDHAMLEAMIKFDPVLEDYTYQGVPDIRVIVFRGFPVMAMLRCATKASDGRANLHQGAIGVGIDLISGGSRYAVAHNVRVACHPDTGKSFADLQIPYWQRILELAASCYEMTALGYIGCDIVLDIDKGPVILELNARPGLAIQMTNAAGLRKRLRAVEKLELEQLESPPAERVRWAQEAFGK